MDMYSYVIVIYNNFTYDFFSVRNPYVAMFYIWIFVVCTTKFLVVR